MTNRTFRKATIKEVAEQAGVSVTTVSHFVSGRERTCSAATAQRITEAIAKLHYSPSSQGRALRLGKTHTIGVCTEAIFDPGEHTRESYTERLWRGISIVAGEMDYALLHYPPSARVGVSANPFLDGRVDGIVFSSDHSDSRPELIASAGLPIIIINRFVSIPPGCGAVYANERDTVFLAMEHLWSLGHRRIAHVAGPILFDEHIVRAHNAQSDVAIERHRYYVEWMKERGAYDPALLALENSWSPQHPADVVAGWRQMSSPPTAAFCADDLLAYGIIDAAREAGLSVPGDLSMIGVDNSWASASKSPRLTTVDIPVEQIGRESVQALLRSIGGSPIEDCRVAVPVTKLVVRDSTAPLL